MVGVVRAVRAEAFRFRRNISVLFWGFAFVPVLYVAFGIVLDLTMTSKIGPFPTQIDPIRQLTRATSLAGNPIAHLFVAIGAASVFGGDYTQKTWRLLGFRVHRQSLLMAKWVVYICAAALGLICSMLGSTIAMLVTASLNGLSYVAVMQPMTSFVTAAFGSILELTVLGTLVAPIAILTRSMLAAVFPAFLLSVGQELVLAYVLPPAHASLWLALPTFAGDIIRHAALGTGWMTPPTPEAVTLAVVSLSIWCVLGLLSTSWLIQRQDWSRE